MGTKVRKFAPCENFPLDGTSYIAKLFMYSYYDVIIIIAIYYSKSVAKLSVGVCVQYTECTLSLKEWYTI